MKKVCMGQKIRQRKNVFLYQLLGNSEQYGSQDDTSIAKENFVSYVYKQISQENALNCYDIC